LKLDDDLLTDLEIAFESSDAECTWYLDLEGGQVSMVTEEIASAHSMLTEEADEQGVELAQAVRQSALADWEKEAVLEADRLEAAFGNTVIAIEQDDSSRAYRDMEDFVASLSDAAISSRLLN